MPPGTLTERPEDGVGLEAPRHAPVAVIDDVRAGDLARQHGAEPTDSHPSWRPTAMGVLSEINGWAPCYPPFSQAVRIHERHRDEVNPSVQVQPSVLGPPQ
jgi:hypothetical protein